ncbi:pseudouridine synthase [Chitinophaga lutea]
MKKSKPAKKGFTPFKENKSSKSGEDRPKKSFGDKPRRSFGEDGDRPRKSYDAGDDRSKRSRDGEDRPKRSFKSDDDRPKRSFGDKEDRPKRSFSRDGEDRPKRSFKSDSDRPKKSYGDGEDRPKRSFSRDGDDRPKRSFSDGEDRPKRSFKSDEDRPKRSFKSDSDRPKKSYGDGEDRPKRSFSRDGEDAPRPRKSERKKAVHGTKTNKPKSTRKRIAVTSKEEADTAEMPLNKFIAHCGICSRRKAVDYIKEGQVSVNGEQITEPAFKVTGKDVVKLNDKRIHLQKNLVYVLLNKPKGYITTTDDPEGRQTVMDLVEDAAEERLFPVGRLDRNTSGLLLLTNDGELAQKLAHPKHNIKKIYHVELDKALTKADFEKILAGVELEDGQAFVDALGYVDPKDKKQLGIEIHSGKNRIVRRIFEHLGYEVEKLDRVMYAGLTKKNINRGQWRFLTDKEVILLKHFK